jgi:TolB-like protein/Tfp pilus assembly protein PilF
MTGTLLAHYEVLETLGSGGMGVVYRARDTRLRRDVAIKVLRNDVRWPADARDRLLREARATSALNHPAICTVHDVEERDGQTFIVMELIQGTPLTLRLTRRGVDPETVTRWGSQLADALEHAHQQGIIHRDVKPSNVVVTDAGQIKLVDFGIAVRAPFHPHEMTVLETVDVTPACAGTAPYMAPEVLRGAIADARSDIWSLGVLLHEAVSGRHPFLGATIEETSAAILRDRPRPLPPHVPRELAGIIGRCLAKEPGARYQRAGEIRAALEAVQARVTHRRPVVSWAVVSVLAVTLVGISAAIMGAPGSERVSAWLTSRASSTAPDAMPEIRGLAVLPLRNIGSDKTQDFFAEGMTSALITQLAKAERLKVISQTSVMRYKAGPERSLPQIGQELGVDAVIEGSVLRVGDRVRVTVDLVEVRTDRHLWAESYERPLEDVLALQNEIARAVADHVQSRVGQPPRPETPAAKVNPKAYELFLRGEISVAQGDPIAVTRAVEYYEQAIAIDPGFAPAYAGLAGAKFAQEYWGHARFMSNMTDVRAATRKALTLDPLLADAHVMMGRILMSYDWDFAGAERSLKEAIDRSPGLPFAHETYAWVLLSLGRRDEALDHAQTAAALDPQSGYMVFTEGRVLHRVRRYRDAEERYKRAITLNPGFGPPYMGLMNLYITQRRFPDARKVWSDLDRLPSVRRSEWLRVKLDVAADGKMASPEILATLEPVRRAAIYVAMDKHDEALRALDRAVTERLVTPAALTDPEWDRIRSDPRFAHSLQRIGLPVDRLVAWGSWPAQQ